MRTGALRPVARTENLKAGPKWALSSAMTTRWMIATAGLGLLLATGCKKGADDSKPPETTPTPETTGRPSLTSAECQEKGGTIVGDIGDGAIHRPDYVCESGQPPIGSIRSAEGEPVAVEGSVCCPAAAAAASP